MPPTAPLSWHGRASQGAAHNTLGLPLSEVRPQLSHGHLLSEPARRDPAGKRRTYRVPRAIFKAIVVAHKVRDQQVKLYPDMPHCNTTGVPVAPFLILHPASVIGRAAEDGPAHGSPPQVWRCRRCSWLLAAGTWATGVGDADDPPGSWLQEPGQGASRCKGGPQAPLSIAFQLCNQMNVSRGAYPPTARTAGRPAPGTAVPYCATCCTEAAPRGRDPACPKQSPAHLPGRSGPC